MYVIMSGWTSRVMICVPRPVMVCHTLKEAKAVCDKQNNSRRTTNNYYYRKVPVCKSAAKT